MNGNHQNGSVGRKVGDEAGCVEAVHLRHLEINHDKIWFGVLEKFDCFPAVTGFVTHAPISLVIQQPAQATSNGWAIVRYENTNQNEISYLSDKARNFPTLIGAYSRQSDPAIPLTPYGAKNLPIPRLTLRGARPYAIGNFCFPIVRVGSK